MFHGDDYAGPLDPDFEFGDLSRSALARLGREFMLCAMMHDRALLPQIGQRFGPDAMTDVAVDEWMGSSPIYNERNRRNLSIGGEGVGAIFKGLQLDIGAPHQFLDFQFDLVSEDLGYFWLPFCGAFEYVRDLTRGNEDAIVQLCHHMEDTTFDATVMAVNGRARCTAEHRPPLARQHSGPMCRWKVAVDHDHVTVPEREITREVRRSRAAQFEWDPLVGAETEGLDDYSGAFKADFALEDLSHPVLVRQCKEFSLDLHLLVRASYTTISQRWGAETMREIARLHWASMAPVYVARIRRALSMEGDDMDAILKMLQLDPCFPPGYARTGVERVDESHGRFWLESCEAIEDHAPRAFLELLSDSVSPGFDAVVASVNPRAKVHPVSPGTWDGCGADAVYAWEIVIDEDAEPWEEPPGTALVRSNVMNFRLQSRPVSR